MKTTKYIAAITVLTVSFGTLTASKPHEGSKPDEMTNAINIIEMAVSTLNNVFENQGNGIPQSLIDQSEAIIIFPRACQVAAGAFNGAGGKGIAMIYDGGDLSNTPFYVTLREGDLGFQIGTQTSDIVLLVKDKNDIPGIDHSSVVLGGEVGVAAGPGHNKALPVTEYKFKSSIYSYHLEEGLFTGVNLKGAILGYAGKFDDRIYSIERLFSEENRKGFLALHPQP